MGAVTAKVRRIRVCGPAAIFGHTLVRPSRNLDFSDIGYLSTPEIGGIACGFCDHGMVGKSPTMPDCVGLRQTNLQMEALPLVNISSQLVCNANRPVFQASSSMPSYYPLKFLGFQNPPHSRGASHPPIGGTRTTASPKHPTIIRALLH
jgi:hypothetical protein